MPNATQQELDAYIALSGAVVEAKNQLQTYLMNNPGDADTERLQNLVVQLGAANTSLVAHSIGLLGEDTAAAVAKLKTISKKGKDFIAQINKIKKALTVVTSLLTLAGAVLIGDARGVLGALKGVNDAIKTDRKADAPPAGAAAPAPPPPPP